MTIQQRLSQELNTENYWVVTIKVNGGYLEKELMKTMLRKVGGTVPRSSYW